MARRFPKNPAAGRGAGAYTVNRVIEFASGVGIGWPTDRVYGAGDAVAALGALVTLVRAFPTGDSHGDDRIVGALARYAVTARNIKHNRQSVGGLQHGLTTVAAVFAATATTEEEFRALWDTVGLSLLRVVESWPEHQAAQYFQVIGGLVEQASMSQMPGYQFGTSADLRMPPPASVLVPGGGGHRPSAPGGASSASTATWRQRSADFVARHLDEVLGIVGTAAGGAALGPGGAIVGGGLGAGFGEELGDILKAKYGTAAPPDDIEVTPADLKEAARRVQEQRRQRTFDLGTQPNLPKVPQYPEPGQTAPGNSPGGPTTRLVTPEVDLRTGLATGRSFDLGASEPASSVADRTNAAFGQSDYGSDLGEKVGGGIFRAVGTAYLGPQGGELLGDLGQAAGGITGAAVQGGVTGAQKAGS